jgi:hypothetical protein
MSKQTTPQQKKKDFDLFGFLPEKQQNTLYCVLFAIFIFAFYSDAIFGNGFSASDNLASESFKTYLADAEKSGKFPLWLPHIFSGMPAYSSLLLTGDRVWDFISNTYYSMTEFVGAIFNNDAARVVTFYVIYAIGLFYLLNEKGLNRMTSFFGAISATFSTSVLAWAIIGHNTKPMVLSLLPFIFFLLFRLKKDFKLLNILLLIVVVHLMLIGAHLQMIFYSACAIGIYLLVELISVITTKENLLTALKPFLVLALAGGIAFGLSADRFLATKVYTPYSTRGSAPLLKDNTVKQTDDNGGNPYKYATMFSFSPAEMKTFLVPSYYGYGKVHIKELGSDYNYLSGAMDNGKIYSYWGQKEIEDAPPYMGIIIFALALAGIYLNRKNPFVWFLGLLSIFSVLISFGYTFPIVYDLFYNYFPSFNKFRAPSMALVLAQFALPLLAAFTLDSFFKKEDSTELKKAGITILAFSGVIALVCLLFTFGKSDFYEAVANSNLGQSIPKEARGAYLPEFQKFIWSNMTADAYKAIFFLLLLGGTIYVVSLNKLSKGIATLIILVASIIDLWSVGAKAMESSEVKLTETATRQKDYYEFIKQDKELFRIADFASPSPNIPAFYRLQNVNGYHSAKLRIYQDLLDVTCDGSTNNVTNPFVWNLLNVKYIVSPRQLGGAIQPAFQSSEGVLVYKNENYLPRAYFTKKVEVAKPLDILNKMKFDPVNPGFNPREVAFIEKAISTQIDSNITNSKVTNTSFANEKIEFDVTAEANNFLVVSEVYYPAGWKAYLNDKEVEIVKTNFALRGIVVPKGNHKLRFEYTEPSFEQGRTISSILSVGLGLGLLASVILEIRNRRKKTE